MSTSLLDAISRPVLFLVETLPKDYDDLLKNALCIKELRNADVTITDMNRIDVAEQSYLECRKAGTINYSIVAFGRLLFMANKMNGSMEVYPSEYDFVGITEFYNYIKLDFDLFKESRISSTHELARKLQEMPDRKVSASLDVSTGEHNAHKRVFSSDLYSVQEDVNEDSITLLFEEAWSNKE